MKKLILPRLLKINSICEPAARGNFDKYFDERYDDLIPEFDFDVPCFDLKVDLDICDEGYYMYAFISTTRYLDDAIVQSADYNFKTYSQYKQALKKMTKDLIQKWKEWVSSLYYDPSKVEESN